MPRFTARRKTAAAPPDRARSAVPSVEPSSTTIGSAHGQCRRRSASARRMLPASLYAGTITATRQPAGGPELTGRPPPAGSDIPRFAPHRSADALGASPSFDGLGCEPGCPFGAPAAPGASDSSQFAPHRSADALGASPSFDGLGLAPGCSGWPPICSDGPPARPADPERPGGPLGRSADSGRSGGPPNCAGCPPGRCGGSPVRSAAAPVAISVLSGVSAVIAHRTAPAPPPTIPPPRRPGKRPRLRPPEAELAAVRRGVVRGSR